MVGFGEKHEKIHRDVEILAPMSPEIGYIWFLHVENREAFVSPSSDIVPFLLCWVSIRRFPTVWDLVTLWQGVGRNLRLRAMCEVFPPPKKAHIALFLRWENKRFDSVVSTIVKIHFHTPVPLHMARQRLRSFGKNRFFSHRRSKIYYRIRRCFDFLCVAEPCSRTYTVAANEASTVMDSPKKN